MIEQHRIDEIRRHEFSRALRGYDPREVDDMVARVAQDMSELLQAYRAQSERVSGLEIELGALKEKESVLSDTLLNAQKIADTLRSSARTEADQIVREASLTGKEIVSRAEDRRMRLEDWFSKAREEWLLELARIRGEVQALFESLERFEDRWHTMALPPSPPGSREMDGSRHDPDQP